MSWCLCCGYCVDSSLSDLLDLASFTFTINFSLTHSLWERESFASLLQAVECVYLWIMEPKYSIKLWHQSGVLLLLMKRLSGQHKSQLSTSTYQVLSSVILPSPGKFSREMTPAVISEADEHLYNQSHLKCIRWGLHYIHVESTVFHLITPLG